MAPDEDEILEIIRGALRDSPAAHKRRIANRQGVREPVTAGCDHAANWNVAKQWCDSCGITLEEIIEQRAVEEPNG